MISWIFFTKTKKTSILKNKLSRSRNTRKIIKILVKQKIDKEHVQNIQKTLKTHKNGKINMSIKKMDKYPDRHKTKEDLPGQISIWKDVVKDMLLDNCK